MLNPPCVPLAIRVLVAEHHAEVLLRCAQAVRDDGRLHLVAAVTTGVAAISMLDRYLPEVLVVDLQLQDLPAIEVIRHAARHFACADIVVLTQFGHDAQLLQCIDAGATAYLFKDRVAEGLAQSIYLWRAGSAPISPGLARRVLQRCGLRLGTGRKTIWSFVQRESPHPFTPGEVDLLREIARGLGLKQTSAVVAGLPLDVLAQVKNIYRKLAAFAAGESGSAVPAPTHRIAALGATCAHSDSGA